MDPKLPLKLGNGNGTENSKKLELFLTKFAGFLPMENIPLLFTTNEFPIDAETASEAVNEPPPWALTNEAIKASSNIL